MIPAGGPPGFEVELLARGSERWAHLCLAGMREWAESVGGGFVWHGRPSAGTVVELSVRARIGRHRPRASGSFGGTVRSTAQHRAGQPSTDAAGEAD